MTFNSNHRRRERNTFTLYIFSTLPCENSFRRWTRNLIKNQKQLFVGASQETLTFNGKASPFVICDVIGSRQSTQIRRRHPCFFLSSFLNGFVNLAESRSGRRQRRQRPIDWKGELESKSECFSTRTWAPELEQKTLILKHSLPHSSPSLSLSTPLTASECETLMLSKAIFKSRKDFKSPIDLYFRSFRFFPSFSLRHRK